MKCLYRARRQALVSCVSIVCLSTADRVKWELVFNPMPEEPYERIANRMSKRLQQFNSNESPDAYAAAVRQTSNVAVAAAAESSVCNCQQDLFMIDLDDDHYPRYLPAFTCQGGQWCKALVYPVLVLAKKTAINSELVGTVYTRQGLPDKIFDESWWFVKYNITVGCTCPN